MQNQPTRFRRLFNILRSSEVTLGVSTSIIVGVVAGLGAVGFRHLITAFQWVFFEKGADWLSPLGDYYIILIPAIGGLLVGFLIHSLASEAKGEGPPEVMEAITIKGGRIRAVVAPVKVLASSICIGSGGSVGREGPIVQIGASAGSAIGQWLRLPPNWIKTFVLCGAAGGVAATFNAPIGGVLFAIEVLQGQARIRHVGFVVISAVAAEFVTHWLLDDSPSFTIAEDYSMVSSWEILPYAMLGLIAGLLSIGFIRLFFACEDIIDHVKIPAYLKPAIGGLLIGGIGYFFPDILGVGYGEILGFATEGGVDKALAGKLGLSMLVILIFVKMAATSITLGSGGSGGIFAPSLFIGAMLGGAMGTIVHTIAPEATGTSEPYAVLGMAAFFAAAVRGPFTSIILLFEMTRNYDLILPLMIVVSISTLVARGISRESIYTRRLVRKGIDIHQTQQADIMSRIMVNELMTVGFPTVNHKMLVLDLVEKLHQENAHGFPVLDNDGKLWGVATLQDVEAAMSRNESGLLVKDIATRSPVVTYPDESVHDALARFGGHDAKHIIVVDRQDSKKLLGVLRRRDIIRAYTKAIGNRTE